MCGASVLFFLNYSLGGRISTADTPGKKGTWLSGAVLFYPMIAGYR
ncbi:hypothetical protein LINPERHAP1_LOCUS29209 [Linum perenne]